MSHTPAPWKGFPNVSGSNPSKKTVVAGDYADEGEPDMLVEVWASDEEVDANARLIASSPELLSSLEALIKGIDEWNAAVQQIIGKVPNYQWGALEEARRVMAKARGDGEDNHE